MSRHCQLLPDVFTAASGVRQELDCELSQFSNSVHDDQQLCGMHPSSAMQEAAAFSQPVGIKEYGPHRVPPGTRHTEQYKISMPTATLILTTIGQMPWPGRHELGFGTTCLLHTSFWAQEVPCAQSLHAYRIHMRWHVACIHMPMGCTPHANACHTCRLCYNML